VFLQETQDIIQERFLFDTVSKIKLRYCRQYNLKIPLVFYSR
jgi:hypothetical protein